jgi:hypothetical protein
MERESRLPTERMNQIQKQPFDNFIETNKCNSFHVRNRCVKMFSSKRLEESNEKATLVNGEKRLLYTTRLGILSNICLH